MSDKVIILTPHPNIPGGVGHYYKTAKPYFSKNVKYVRFNGRYEKGVLKTVTNIFVLFKALCIIAYTMPKTVVVNPSLGKTAFLRDAIFLFWSRLMFRKTIVFWRGWNPKQEVLFESSFMLRVFNTTYKKAVKHIVLNRYIKQRLSDLGVITESIKFANTIVDNSYFNSVISKESDAKFIILFLTRVETYKGIYEALEMFKELDNKQMEFHIAGKGSEMQSVKNYVKEHHLHNVKFLGYVSGDEKILAFKKADVYVFPSYSEGMPNSVLEAMGAGLPVICTRVGALKDFFQDSKMGFSHDLPIDVSDFVSSCEKIFNDRYLKEEMSQFNINYSREHFIASKSIEKLEALISNS